MVFHARLRMDAFVYDLAGNFLDLIHYNNLCVSQR